MTEQLNFDIAQQTRVRDFLTHHQIQPDYLDIFDDGTVSAYFRMAHDEHQRMSDHWLALAHHKHVLLEDRLREVNTPEGIVLWVHFRLYQSVA